MTLPIELGELMKAVYPIGGDFLFIWDEYLMIDGLGVLFYSYEIMGSWNLQNLLILYN